MLKALTIAALTSVITPRLLVILEDDLMEANTKHIDLSNQYANSKGKTHDVILANFFFVIGTPKD